VGIEVDKQDRKEEMQEGFVREEETYSLLIQPSSILDLLTDYLTVFIIVMISP
jgi:hypothetical protein